MPVEKSTFAAEVVPGRDATGRDVLVLVAKRTYLLDPETSQLTLEGLDAQPPLEAADAFADGGDFLTAPLIAEGELAPFKPRADVVVLGKAYAPGGEPQPEFEVAIQVGARKKRLRVIGERRVIWVPPKKETKKEIVYRPPRFTDPEPLSELPLDWRHAWGGSSPILPLIPPHMRQAYLDEQARAQEAQQAAADEAARAAAPAQEEEASQEAGTQVLDVSTLQAPAPGAPQGAAAAATDADGTQILRVGETVEGGEDWHAGLRGPAPAAPSSSAPEAFPEGHIPCPLNPIGKGFALGHSQEALDGLTLPQIEDPAHPITPEGLSVDLERILEPGLAPAGFGWVPKGSWLRARHAGFTPEEAQAAQAAIDEQLLQMAPDDPEQRPGIEALLGFEAKPFDARFWNAAPEDQQLPEIRGDEEISLTNLDPTGTTRFSLPGRAPIVTLDRGRGPEPVLPTLDTLVIDREAGRVTLLWRGHLPYGGPAELETYPRFDLDVHEVGLIERHDEWRRLAGRAGGADPDGTQVLRVVDDQPTPQAPPAAPAEPGAAPARPADLPEDEQGTRVIRLAEEGRERQDGDAAWVTDAARARTPEELEAEAKRKAEIAEKKAALRARLDAIYAEDAKKKK